VWATEVVALLAHFFFFPIKLGCGFGGFLETLREIGNFVKIDMIVVVV
jgi:hypothetical protein